MRKVRPIGSSAQIGGIMSVIFLGKNILDIVPINDRKQGYEVVIIVNK